MNTAAPNNIQIAKRPVLLRLLVVLWALPAGGGIVKDISLVVRMLSGNRRVTAFPVHESLAWVGASLLLLAVLVAACYAMFNLRRSAVRLFGCYLFLWGCIKVASWLLHPNIWAPGWAIISIHGILVVVTLGYLLHLKSRGLLV